jgi:hypothetical protein
MSLRPRCKAIPHAAQGFPPPEAPICSASAGAKNALPPGAPNYSTHRWCKQHLGTSMHSTRSNKLQKFTNAVFIITSQANNTTSTSNYSQQIQQVMDQQYNKVFQTIQQICKLEVGTIIVHSVSTILS